MANPKRGGSRLTVDSISQMSCFASSITNRIGFAASRSGQAKQKHLCPAGSKRFLGRAALGAALMVGCLHAGAASALSFDFSFTGIGSPSNSGTVTGTIDGLVDNLNHQVSGLTLTIASATNGPVGTTYTDLNFVTGTGFDVSGGQLTGADAKYLNGNLVLELANLRNSAGYYESVGGGSSFNNVDFNNTLVFSPIAGPASVPGPLPLFGAGAAFGWSRRLRRRIKSPA